MGKITLREQIAMVFREMQENGGCGFEKLYNLTQEYVKRKILKNVSYYDDWEDIMQEVYLAVYLNYTSVKNAELGMAWISMVAFHKCCDYQRMNYMKKENEDSDCDISEKINITDPLALSPEEAVEEMETKAYLRGKVREMPEKTRRIIWRFYFDKKKVREIAKEMNMPEGTVKARLYRGRKQLVKETRPLMAG